MPDRNNGESGFIHVVKNEYALFAYRFITGGCALLMTWWVLDLKNATYDIRKDFNASLVANEVRLGKLEGTVSVMDNAIRMQSRSIESNQAGVQQLWNRIYEMNQARPPR